MIVKSFQIGPADAKKIEQCNEEDIADTVFEVVKLRSSNKSTLTIKEVDEVLEKLCENHQQQFQQQQFQILLHKGSPQDQKWIVRIILKNMKLRIGVNKILANYDIHAPALFQKYNHLSKVCGFIENGESEEALKDVVKPFVPIRPMLSQKFTSKMNQIFTQFEFFQEVNILIITFTPANVNQLYFFSSFID